MQLSRPISHGWHRSLVDLLGSAKRHILVCSPFVGADGIRLVTESVPATFVDSGRVTCLTNLSVSNICQLSTDPRAIKALVDVLQSTLVFHVPGLHAKAYIADEDRAIVTSGNLTAGGLYRNLEYGVELRDRAMVGRIRNDLLEFAQLGVAIPHQRLNAYCDAVADLSDSIGKAQQSAQQAIRERFRQALNPIEDDLIRLRLGSGSVHAVFAKTIEYLLRTHGALTTIQIHPLVASIHPDLCDNSTERIIDGKRFGKKWKHAVRTAQQQLKKQGRIIYEHSAWRVA